MNRGLHGFILPVLWMAVIFLLSSIPGSSLPGSFPGADKIVHLAEYTILGFLLGKRGTWIAIPIGIIYGVLDEVHQIYVPYREFSISDILVDGTGVVTGTICRSLLRR